MTVLGAPNTNHVLNPVLPVVAVGATPKYGKAVIWTVVAVETDVLGDVHAEDGVTELTGVPGSTL